MGVLAIPFWSSIFYLVGFISEADVDTLSGIVLSFNVESRDAFMHIFRPRSSIQDPL